MQDSEELQETEQILLEVRHLRHCFGTVSLVSQHHATRRRVACSTPCLVLSVCLLTMQAPESAELTECAGDDDRDTDNAWVQ